MNESFPKTTEVKESPEESFENFNYPEEVPNSIGEVFAEIKMINELESSSIYKDVETTLEELSENLDNNQTGISQKEVYLERAALLEERQDGLKKRFFSKVREILLPTLTAVSIGGAPAIAEAFETDRNNNEENVSQLISAEQNTVDTETFQNAPTLEFDGSSVLRVGAINRERSKEELNHLHELSRLVYEANREWLTITGIDKDGKHTAVFRELGPLGGEVDVSEDLTKIEKEIVLRHTHPISAFKSVRSSGGFEKNPFIMAPSIVDISQCFDDKKITNFEVVDPRGVWSYSCDKDSVFSKAKSAFNEEVTLSLKGTLEKYKVKPEDNDSVDVSMVHPSVSYLAIFSALENKYPGISADFNNELSNITRKNMDLLNKALQYEEQVTDLVSFSRDVKNSDADISVEIKSLVDKAKGIGINLTYQPYNKVK